MTIILLHGFKIKKRTKRSVTGVKLCDCLKLPLFANGSLYLKNKNETAAYQHKKIGLKKVKRQYVL